MGRFLLLVAAVALVGCNRSAPSTGAPTSATSGTAAAVDPGAETEEERAYRVGTIADLVKQNEESDKLREQEVRLMDPGNRRPIEEIRAVFAMRPAVELTDEQQPPFKYFRKYWKLSEVAAYRVALGDQAGGLPLAHKLKLDPRHVFLFRYLYGEQEPAKRERVRVAVEKANSSGMRSLTAEQRDELQPFAMFIASLPD